MGTGGSKPGGGGEAGSDLKNHLDDDLKLDAEYERTLEQRRKEIAWQKNGGSASNSDQKSNQRIKPPKIVGLEESDDEEATSKPPRGRRKEENDIRVIDDLNKTFDDLGFAVGQARSQNVRKESDGKWEDETNEYLNMSMTHTRFGPGTSMGRRHSSTMTAGPQNRGGVPVPAQRNLKFSWDNSKLPPDKENEEWTYKKTVIDGFDPDKFRKVNSKPTNAGTSNSAPTVSIGRNDFGSSTASMDVPGAVPTYDTTEQQLLASIEHELGVI